jgi:AAA domain
MMPFDPQLIPQYKNNLLIAACGPILSTQELLERLTYTPDEPANLENMPVEIRKHQMMTTRLLHIPSKSGIEVAQSIDLMLRQGYVNRNPKEPITWNAVYNDLSFKLAPEIPPLASYICGISGSGKSMSVERPLQFIQQVVTHQNFPHMLSPFTQLVWIKVDAPSSGKSVDLAIALMRETDRLLNSTHFSKFYNAANKYSNGVHLLDIWLAKAKTHFLGLLVIDEVSNLFKIESLKKRMQKSATPEKLPLRIVDDETIKFCINLNNTSSIPLIAIGTPDGMQAFATRLSTTERLITGGYHEFLNAKSSKDSYFKKYMMNTLFKYQWFPEKLQNTDEIIDLIYRLSAGVPRIYIALWYLAHRSAFDRGAKGLQAEDFLHASNTYMAPLRPAISALISNQPNMLSVYEDLLPRDDAFWASLFAVK